MSNERILSFKKSKKLDLEQAKNVSAAGGMTSYITANGSYNSATHSWDPSVDAVLDL